MSSPTLVATGPIKATIGTQSVPWPAHQTADVALLWVQTCNQAISFSDAQGFVEIVQVGTGTAAVAGSTRLGLFWARATSGNMTPPVLADAGDHLITRMQIIRGCVTTGNPWDVFASDVQATTDTTVEVPGATTTVIDTLILAGIGNGLDLGVDQVNSWVNAALTGVATAISGNHAIGLGGGIDIMKGVKATAGAYGTSTATAINAMKQARISIAMRSGTTTPATAPTHVSTGVGQVNAAGTITVPWGTHQADDVGLLIVATSNEAITFSNAQGFVEVTNSPQSFGTAGAITAIRLGVYWRRATGSSMASPVVNDPGDIVTGQILVFRGCITTGNPWNITAGDNSSANSAVSVPGATSTSDKSLVVAICADTRSTNSTAQYSGWTNSSLVSITEIADYHTGQGGGVGFGAACGEKAVAGAYGATLATLAGSVQQARLSLALTPAAGSPTAPPGDASAPHQFWRLVKKTAAAAGPKINQVQLVRRTKNAGTTTSRPDAPALVHPGVTHFKPCLYLNQGSDLNAVFDVDVFLCSLPAGYSADIPTDQVTKSVESFVYDDGILRPDVGQTDGAGVLPLVKGTVRGIGQHGDVIRFSDAGRVFQTVPKLSFRGGIVHNPGSTTAGKGWGTAAEVDAGTANDLVDSSKPQYEDFGAQGLNESGFTLMARLRQDGLVSALRTIAWPGTHLTGINDEIIITTLTNAPSRDDTYTVRMGGQARIRSKNAGVFQFIHEFAIESTINSGATWQTAQFFRQVWTTTSLTYETLEVGMHFSINVPGLTADGTDRLRIRLLKTSSIGLGYVDLANTYLFGTTGTTFGSTAGLEFVDSVDSYSSKTPGAGDIIHWEAVGYV